MSETVCGWWSIPDYATSWCPLPKGHDGKHAASMTADVTREPTGGQELREVIADAEGHMASAEPMTTLEDVLPVDVRTDEQRLRMAVAGRLPAGIPIMSRYRITDAVLALPEVAALIADAERVKRVRELAEEWDRTFTASGQTLGDLADRLRRALDGEPQL